MAKLIKDQPQSLPARALKAVVAVGTGTILVATSVMVVVGVTGAAVVQTTLGGLAIVAVWGAGKAGMLENRSLRESGRLIMPNFISVEFNVNKDNEKTEEIKEAPIKPNNIAQSYGLRKAKREAEKNTQNTDSNNNSGVENIWEKENSNVFRP